MKKGFTLAESLLVMAILGVIAGLTTPALVADAQKRANATGCQKAYNVLSKAADYVYNEKELKVSDMTDANTEMVFGYFEKVIPMMKICRDAEGCWPKTTLAMNGGPTDECGAKGCGAPARAFITNDGMAYTLDVDPNSHYEFFVDVNGIEKGPNKFGYDIFGFIDKVDGQGLKPMGSQGMPYESAGCSKSTGGTQSGLGCAAKVIKDGKISW